MSLDTRLYLDTNHFARHTAWAHAVMKLLAVDAVALFGVLVLTAWWNARRRGDVNGIAASLWTALATVIAVGINQPIGSAVARLRPFQSIAHVEVLVSRTHDFSFPSDHSVLCGAAAAGLWIVASSSYRSTDDKLTTPITLVAVFGTVLAVAIAFSRVYVGSHYPADVVAGLLLGAAVTVGGWMLLGRWTTELVNRIGTVGWLKAFVRPASAPERKSSSLPPPQ